MSDLKNKGWVRLHRQLEDNPLWFLEPFTKAQAWIDLFLNANHKENIIQIRGNVVKIKRGQLGWSELTMTKRWMWSKNRTRRFLKLLETEQQIIQQKDRYITTIITILNYDKYQTDTADDTAERQQKDSRRYINKNDKNDKNDKNKEDMSAFADEFNQFWLKYPKKELKKKTQEIWQRKKLDNHLKVILDFIGRAKNTDRWQKGYIKQPPAFLNGECWNDDLTAYNDKKQTQTGCLDLRKIKS